MRTQPVVVQVQMLQRHVGSEESDQGRLGIQAKGVVVEVDRAQVGQVENRSKEGGKRFGDFVEKTAGEDVGKVGNLADRQVSMSLLS